MKRAIEIPYKFPSFNEYINECKKHRMAGARMKKRVEYDIGWFINKLPEFKKPVKIHFHWVEGNKKRDLDNIMVARKFIIDAMVKSGKLEDDGPKYVVAFLDTFSYSDEWKVIMKVEEVEK